MIVLVLLSFTSASTQNNISMERTDQLATLYERSGGTETPEYKDGIAYFKLLAEQFNTIEMQNWGPTDSGEPLSLVLYSHDGIFDIQKNKALGRAVLLINNGIHPGEPDGIDASMLLLRGLAEGKLLQSVNKDVLIAVLPYYNIGGAINRNSYSRTNQNGPKAYGFRGNGRNYDLNRDFIKCDTRNARSFAEIFHHLDPDLFLDTHVSNGADYQYVMTLVYSQKDKLGEPLKTFQEELLRPFLFDYMKNVDDEMTPYVNIWGSKHRHPTPDKGIEQFPDYPRYSTGYTALFNTIGFMTETHMLKPYAQRVESTLNFMRAFVTAASTYKTELIKVRTEAKQTVSTKKTFPIKWEADLSKSSMLDFKGFNSGYKKSQISGADRLYYDNDTPFKKEIPYYDSFKDAVVVDKPEFYIIPQAWHTIVDLFKINNIVMEPLAEDTILEVQVYHIDSYKSYTQPYEGHFPHYDIELRSSIEKVAFRKGDFMVPVNQYGNRYIIETLEPQAEDSFFKWNFFDMILQRKEGYSSYVFEDLAVEIFESNPEIKSAFESRLASDEEFKSNPRAQLHFIYEQSQHAESAYKRYPIYRLME
ncbi:MAG: hypothetical protein HKN09_00655 [Saprospiraceae bacterium]|nr:hypothetical protein [Saprospiraceae bacterium]